MSRLKELREERKGIHEQMIAELAKPQTAEIRAKVDLMIADIDAKGADIQRIERADAISKELAIVPVDPTADQRSAEQVAKDNEKLGKTYRSAFVDHLRWGAPGNKWQRGAADENFKNLLDVRNAMQRAQTPEQRDQIAGTQSITYTQGNVGGFFVPAGFVYDVEKATKYFAPLLDGSVIRTLETATGQVLPYPTSNDTNQAWTLVGETTQVVDQGTSTNYPTQGTAPSGQPGNVLLGHINFNAYKGSTGLIRVSLELLQDSAFNIETFLAEAFAIRLARGYEYYLTNGSGTNAPTGILPAIAASGATPVVAVGSAANTGGAETGTNSIGYVDLVNLVHSVDPSYRRNGKIMFHDNTLRYLKTLLDKFGRPLWVPGVKEGEPDTIVNFPYVINQSFPKIGASNVTCAFGDFSKFIARKVKDLQVLRLDERFADFGEVAYVGFSRIDSNLVDAGTHPLNVLQQHA